MGVIAFDVLEHLLTRTPHVDKLDQPQRPRDEETNPLCSPRSDLRRRAVGRALPKKQALLLEGRVRLFPTRHREGRRRV